ncbi:MAG: hypothetical protein HGA23_12145 [Bacteroidales bacterium]|nr:hypothetical protein [Bacteroidales bacterium]
MIKRHYSKGMDWIGKHRFKLLLAATILVLIIPAFSGVGTLGEILFVTSMSFLFIQSMLVATTKKSKRIWLRYLIVVLMITMFLLEPFGYSDTSLDIARLPLPQRIQTLPI